MPKSLPFFFFFLPSECIGWSNRRCYLFLKQCSYLAVPLHFRRPAALQRIATIILPCLSVPCHIPTSQAGKEEHQLAAEGNKCSGWGDLHQRKFKQGSITLRPIKSPFLAFLPQKHGCSIQYTCKPKYTGRQPRSDVLFQPASPDSSLFSSRKSSTMLVIFKLSRS